MTDRREWPSELWMARVDDSPSWYVSCCDTPRQPEDRRYVLAELIPIVREALEQINKVYPPNNFTGVSGDAGVQTVVAVRDGLAEMVQWYEKEAAT